MQLRGDWGLSLWTTSGQGPGPGSGGLQGMAQEREGSERAREPRRTQAGGDADDTGQAGKGAERDGAERVPNSKDEMQNTTTVKGGGSVTVCKQSTYLVAAYDKVDELASEERG
jgi:hypothetical protein